MYMIEYVSAGLVFVGISAAAFQILMLLKNIKTAGSGSFQTDSPLLSLVTPVLTYIAPLNAKLNLEKYRAIIKIKFRQAGEVHGFTVDLFLAAKEVSAVVLAILSIFMFGIPDSGLSLFVILCSGLFGWFIPNLILSSHIQEREKHIVRELPYILDLLTVSVEAGLDFMQAIERVINTMKSGTLVQELNVMHQGLQVGKSRRQVLRDLAFRTEVADVKAVVSALVQAEQLGTGIGTVLRTVSTQARTQRSQRAEKMAGEATVKLLFPLMLVFAAVMLMVIGPVAIQICKTIQAH